MLCLHPHMASQHIFTAHLHSCLVSFLLFMFRPSSWMGAIRLSRCIWAIHIALCLRLDCLRIQKTAYSRTQSQLVDYSLFSQLRIPIKPELRVPYGFSSFTRGAGPWPFASLRALRTRRPEITSGPNSPKANKE